MTRIINSAGLALIQEYEGCKLEPYRDGAGLWTIGYGHRCPIEQMPISQEQANQLLEADLVHSEQIVSAAVHVPLNDNQFAALVSLVFNVGPTKFIEGNLLKKLNEGGYALVPIYLRSEIHDANGNVEQGLVRRRNAEADLFTMKGN